jgi:BlaI family transcriptional regulator, penicillinase repressor
MHLPKAEEQVMEYIWAAGKIFLKDLVDSFPEPKPAATTVATLLKRLQGKDFVGYKLYGNSREYYPLVSKEDYFSGHFKKIIRNYFNDSALQFASFFTRAHQLTSAELKELRNIIDDEIKKKKK